MFTEIDYLSLNPVCFTMDPIIEINGTELMGNW